MSAVQRLGTFTVIHLGRFEGMPEEMKHVRLFFATSENGHGDPRSSIFIEDGGPAFSREAPAPSQFVSGILAAAREIDDQK